MAESAELLRMEGVRKRFGATVALDRVDLKVQAGEVLALVGENGAGKSTLMKMLSGAHAPNKGFPVIRDKRYKRYIPCRPAGRTGQNVLWLAAATFPSVVMRRSPSNDPQLGLGGFVRRSLCDDFY